VPVLVEDGYETPYFVLLRLMTTRPKGATMRVTARQSKPRQPRRKQGRGRAQTAPLARQRINTTRSPNIRSSGVSTRVRHREYIADVAGVVGFSAVTYAVNPGIAATFPWLSTVADRYESYKFHKLHFVFETDKSASTDGSVQGLIDFDAADSAPTTKANFMGHANAVRSAVWQEFRFDAKAKDLHKFAAERYVRAAALASNLDIKTYDVGNFFMGAAGCADTSVVGELYVEYDVELTTPQLNPAALSVPTATLQVFRQGGTLAATNVCGSAPTTYGAAYATAATNTITFTSAGTFVIEIYAAGTLEYGGATGTATAVAAIAQQGTFSPYSGIGVYTATIGQTIVLDTVSSSNTDTTYANFIHISESTDPSLTHQITLMCKMGRRFRPTRFRHPEIEECHLADSVCLTPEQKSSGDWMKVK
jgi:hypothetical protein